ncbi:hypothetical protein CA13_72340 [Planctomycetes bacterium CA13]|uniref:Ribonuclease HIII n=1 Tax=Novipirellula herctigrandis TaxID=2527986 RepID=A0A5C5YPA7_9BACT|nr:hypothetical protein CA13_72340 [Planctomycetes bacterium CA13]
MLLIAVDEAGYGPRLGPLVVAATAWRLPDQAATKAAMVEAFDSLRKPIIAGERTLLVDDSKKVFHPRGRDSLGILASVASVCRSWSDCSGETMFDWLGQIAADDLVWIKKTPWLSAMLKDRLEEMPDANEVIDQWCEGEITLEDVQTRIVTASQFNQAIERGQNKSDLLSDLSLGLVASIVEANRNESKISVFCDRHGGRRYYGGLLQHFFNESMLRVISETATESHYELSSKAETIEIRFTVKGDSFTPVALSSMHAKYLRELCMNELNRYFAQHAKKGQTIVPTAGYPSDAGRFLSEIDEIIQRKKIKRDRLVRCR